MKKCTRCNRELALESFQKNTKTRDGLRSWCKECVGKQKRAARLRSDGTRKRIYRAVITDTEKQCCRCGNMKPFAEFNKNPKSTGGLASQCRQCISTYNKARYRVGDAAKRASENAKRWHENNRERRREIAKNYARRLKAEVIAHYGGECVCCGENRSVFLTLDHVNNDGAAHRALLREDGAGLYQWCKSHGFPADMQVLCWNCNMAKQYLGTCPHQSGEGKTSAFEWLMGMAHIKRPELIGQRGPVKQ